MRLKSNMQRAAEGSAHPVLCGVSMTDAERSLLVIDHLSLVRSLALKLFYKLRGNVEVNELISIGTEGLIEASHRFDSSRGARFSTFAYFRVRGAMYDAVGRLGPLPRSVYRQQRECTTKTPIFIKHYDDGMRDVLDDRSQTARDRLLHNERSTQLSRALDSLSARKRRLIERCYFGETTIQEAGRELGVSKSWASRLHAQALIELRSAMEAVADTSRAVSVAQAH